VTSPEPVVLKLYQSVSLDVESCPFIALPSTSAVEVVNDPLGSVSFAILVSGITLGFDLPRETAATQLRIGGDYR